MSTGSMCMMRCNVKRRWCDDDIDNLDDDDGEVKFDYFAFNNIIYGAVRCNAHNTKSWDFLHSSDNHAAKIGFWLK